jgi:quercetin dioxygenase-like cupin family protein
MSTVTKSAIFDLTALVAYQTGSVVSRQVTKATGGNVTIFAFDEGQELSEHTAPFDALVHVLDGEAEVKISGQPFQLKAGEGIIMPANAPHALLARKKFKMLLTMLQA